MTRHQYLIVGVFLVVPFVAYAALGPRYGGQLTIGVTDLPTSLEPTACSDPGARLVQRLTHETLVLIDADGDVRPSLADLWIASASGLEWTLTINARTRFHDGTPLTADDVVRSLRRFIRSTSSAAADAFAAILDGGRQFRLGKTSQLPGLGADGSNQIVIRLIKSDPRPLVPLASTAAAIINAKGKGCGPFSPLNLAPRRGITLLAFEEHARGRPFLDRIRIELFKDPGAAQAAFHNGRINAAFGNTGHALLDGTLMLWLDSSQPPFDDQSFRAAVGRAIDREILSRRYIPGSTPAVGLLDSRLLSQPELALPSPTHKTRSVASIELTVSDDVPRFASQRIVAHLSALGLQVQVHVVSSARRPGKANARLFIFRSEVADAFLALYELALLSGAPGAVMQTLERARGDGDSRMRILAATNQELLRQGSLLPLVNTPIWFDSTPTLHGERWGRNSELILEDAWIGS